MIQHRDLAGIAIEEISEGNPAALVKEESIEWLADLQPACTYATAQVCTVT